MQVKSPFDFLTSICSADNTSLMRECPEGKGHYLPFIINRSLSYHQDTILLANEMNKYPNLTTEQQYDFLRLTVRPRKRFAKFMKPEVDPKVDVIAKYYNISKKSAKPMADLLTSKQIKEMQDALSVGGKSNK